MSAIDIATPTTGAGPAGSRSPAAKAGKDDGGFSRVFEAVARQPEREAADRRTGHEQAGADTPLPGEEPIRDGLGPRRGAGALGAAREDETGQPGMEKARRKTGEAEDDLTRFLAVAAPTRPAASDDTEQKPSVPLQRDVARPLPGAAEGAAAPAGTPQKATLKVLGRETHFAPVTTQPPATRAGTAPADIAAAVADGDGILPEPAPKAAAERAAGAEGSVKGNANGDTGRAYAPHAAAGRFAVNEPVGGGRALDEAPRHVQSPATVANGASAIAAAVTGDAALAEAGPLVRISDHIAAQARGLNLAPGGAGASTDALHKAGQGGPVRILKLQLQPEELGLVTARLRIVGGVLELRLTVDRQQSVEVLQQDRDGLIEALRRAGYKAEIASIEFAKMPPQTLSQTPAGNGQPAQGSGAQGSGTHGSGAHGFTGQEGGSASGGSDRAPGQGGGGTGRGHAQTPVDEARSTNGDTAARRTDDAQAIYL